MQNEDQDIQALVESGDKIQAIKLYRERYGAGLKEAKDVIDAMAAGMPPPDLARIASDPVEAEQFRTEIEGLLRQGQKIQAIKRYREQTGQGLAESKEVIERWAEQIGAPAAPAPGGIKRCFIATAAFGSENAPEVALLRDWRDEVLARSIAGRVFIRLYYVISPPMARWLERRPAARAAVRALLRSCLNSAARVRPRHPLR